MPRSPVRRCALRGTGWGILCLDRSVVVRVARNGVSGKSGSRQNPYGRVINYLFPYGVGISRDQYRRLVAPRDVVSRSRVAVPIEQHAIKQRVENGVVQDVCIVGPNGDGNL